MTENEAIRDLQYLVGEYSAYPPETGVSTTIGSLQYCISALKEIQQYREIGTVEDIKQAIGVLSLSENDIVETFHELNEYRKIGTVEECREAMGKHRPKKPKDSLKINPVLDGNGAYADADTTVYLLCPNCEELVGIEENCDNYCRECGQKIDKESEEE